MRAAVSIILAATLVTTPLKLVLAQAGQQELSARTTDSTVTPPITPARIGVPMMDGKAALLWQATDLKPMEADSLAYFPPFRRSSEGKVGGLIIIGFLLVAVVYVLLISGETSVAPGAVLEGFLGASVRF